MMRYLLWVLLFLLLTVTGGAQAANLAGVPLPDAIETADHQRLLLNGAGIRKKFFIKIYVGALYLPMKTDQSSSALSQPGSKQVLMHFLYDGVSQKKIVDAWSEGFHNNLDAQAYAAMLPRIERFNAMFEEMKRGDEVTLTYLPGKGTEVKVKGNEKGWIEGEDFMRAMLNIWLGGVPADTGLKKGMLGGG